VFYEDTLFKTYVQLFIEHLCPVQRNYYFCLFKKYLNKINNLIYYAMTKKTVNYNPSSINKLPNDKPVVYKILTDAGNNNYTGIAHRGRVQDRINEHLGEIPGAKVQIEQMHSISEARQKEANIIQRSQPKYNKQGK
jgi:hypothetical protein